MLHWIKPCVDHNRIVHVLLQSTGMHYPLSSKMSQKHFCPCFVKKYGVDLEEKNLQRPHSWFGLLIFEKALIFQNCFPQKDDSPITSLQLLLLMCPSWIARSEEKCSTAPLLRGLWDLNIIVGVSKLLFFCVSSPSSFSRGSIRVVIANEAAPSKSQALQSGSCPRALSICCRIHANESVCFMFTFGAFVFGCICMCVYVCMCVQLYICVSDYVCDHLCVYCLLCASTCKNVVYDCCVYVCLFVQISEWSRIWLATHKSCIKTFSL